MEHQHAIIRFEGPLEQAVCVDCGGRYLRQPSPEVARIVADDDRLTIQPLCWDCAAAAAPVLQDMILLRRKAIDIAFKHFADVDAD
jgi:NAD-dependent SIR2 family protein deacetylase